MFSIIDDPVSTAALRHRQTFFNTIDDDYLFHAINAFQRLYGDQPHRACAVNQRHIMLCGLCMPGDIGRDSERLHHHRMFIFNRIGNVPRIFRRYDGVFTESPIAMHTQYHQRSAHVWLTDRTRIALAAANDRINGYTLTEARLINTLAHRINHAEKFMADHAWIFCKGIMSTINMAIGAADTGEFDFDAYVACRRSR
ncbi:hypothetical protein D3C78_1186040 [compost metagenome]